MNPTGGGSPLVELSASPGSNARPTEPGGIFVSPTLEAVAAIGTRDRFEVAYTLYALDVDAATVGDLAAETPLSNHAVDGAEYELTEFGRLLLEEGVLALFEAAERVDEVAVDAL